MHELRCTSVPASFRCVPPPPPCAKCRTHPQMWVGRWAMMGFVSSIVVEAATGRGTLGQLGLYTPSSGLLTAMLVLFGGATVVGSVATVQSILTKKMSRK